MKRLSYAHERHPRGERFFDFEAPQDLGPAERKELPAEIANDLIQVWHDEREGDGLAVVFRNGHITRSQQDSENGGEVGNLSFCHRDEAPIVGPCIIYDIE